MSRPRDPSTINEIIIHCSATPEGKNYPPEEIERWHTERGWRGKQSNMGYHFYIDLFGVTHEGRGLDETGAHVKNRNARTIGICYCGGLSADGKYRDWRAAKDTRNGQQKQALTKLVKKLCRQYPNIRNISGHNDYANKACPSFNVKDDPLSRIPDEVRQEKEEPVTPDPEPREDPPVQPLPPFVSPVPPKPVPRPTFLGWIARLFSGRKD